VVKAETDFWEVRTFWEYAQQCTKREVRSNFRKPSCDNTSNMHV